MLQPIGAFSILSWESEDPAVATVADGLVTAVANGETTITVTTENSLNASCTVIVGVLPTQISLNSTKLLLNTGDSFKLVPSVDQGEAAYSYTSSNPLVAVSDENGMIAAIGAGAAEITVSTERGLSVVCVVTVEDLPIEEQIARMDVSDEIKEELLLSVDLGILKEKAAQEYVSGREMSQLLDRFIEYSAPEKMEAWREKYLGFREYDDKLTRRDTTMALYLAALEAGEEYISETYEDVFPFSMLLDRKSLDVGWCRGLFGDAESRSDYVVGTFGEGYLDGAAYCFNLSRVSDFSGEFPISYDFVNDSFHYEDDASYADAALAISRLISSANPGEFGKLPANQANSSVLTPDRIEKSNANKETSAEDHPHWTGFVLNYEDGREITATGKNMQLISDWGFNSVRVCLEYWDFFDKDDTSEGDSFGLHMLDGLVAAAIENDLHLDICFTRQPGRWGAWSNETFESVGEFDLFINPEKQEQAIQLWQNLAERYKDVSSANLTFNPIWEANNKNLSTGLPYEDYSFSDIGKFLNKVAKAIWEKDADRTIIYEGELMGGFTGTKENLELKKEIEDLDNLMICYVGGGGAYVLYNITATEGENIDGNNHTLPLPEYPTYYYGVRKAIDSNGTLKFTGCLPAGTVIDLHLDKTHIDGTLSIKADGKELYREYLKPEEYNVGYSLSRYYMYAASEKHIRLTLAEDTDLLTIGFSGLMEWSGLDVILPEEYAQEKWYYVTDYDVFLGVEEEAGLQKKTSSRIIISPTDRDEGKGTEIVIHDDLRYTSDILIDEESARSLDDWAQKCADFDGNAVMRFGSDFSGAYWKEAKEYTADVLATLNKHGFSWWSEDFSLMTDPFKAEHDLVGVTMIPYAGFEKFNLEQLQLLQQYQSKDTIN